MRVSRLKSSLSDHDGRLIICVPDKSESVKRINCTAFQISKNNLWHIHGCIYRVLVGKRDRFEDPGVESGIVLKWIFKKWNGRGHGLDSSG